MLGEILDDLLTSPSTGPCITATRHFAAKPPVLVPFPPSLDPRIADGLRARGIRELYSHQARAWELIEKGHHVVVVTPTASGKTLCYNLPALQSLLRSEEHTSELQSRSDLVCRLLLEKKKHQIAETSQYERYQLVDT